LPFWQVEPVDGEPDDVLGSVLEPTPQTHEGFEWLYGLNGHPRLLLGERDLTLSPGEAAEFDTSPAALAGQR
jgi:hypothetical protein